MSQNKVKFGIEDAHVAFFDESTATEGSPAWDAPQAINGAVSLTMDPEGDQNDFYADNTKYYTSNTNNGYTGTLEVANIPDDILAEMLGMTVDTNGMLVESAEDEQKEFALLGEIKGDEKDRRFVYYRCKAARPSQDSTTSDTGETPNTDSLEVTVIPIESGDKKLVKGVLELDDANQAVFDEFFNEVILPGHTVA
jgi:phi13 family phage major tail protein